jgi:hypothetical protein
MIYQVWVCVCMYVLYVIVCVLYVIMCVYYMLICVYVYMCVYYMCIMCICVYFMCMTDSSLSLNVTVEDHNDISGMYVLVCMY